jgi:uncharacterized RDD family membrane protein YckC
MSDSTPTPPPEGSQPPPQQPPPTERSGYPTGQPSGQPNGQPSGQPGGQPGYGAPAGQPAYPTGQPGYGPAPTGAGQPADLLIRFLARLIDGIIVGIVVQIVDRILLQGIFGMNASSGYSFDLGDVYLYSAVSGVIGALLYLGYFVLMESRNGQTVGKMLLKLRTVGPGGAMPTTQEAFRRNFWVGLGVLAIIPFGGVLGGLAEFVIVIVIAVTISQSPTKQGWHDNLAGGTQVLKVG